MVGTEPLVTFAQHLRPRQFAQSQIYDIALIIAGSLFIALFSRISIPVGFSPVPITGQTFAVLLVGGVLGSTRGTLAVLAYLTEGLAGLPVGAGGAFGVLWLLGPTGGYLLGFLAAAFITGWLAERGWDRSPGRTMLAMTLGTIAIFIPGLIWLGLQAEVIEEWLPIAGVEIATPENVLKAGLWLHLPGAMVKIVLAAVLLPTGWKILGMIPPSRPRE